MTTRRSKLLVAALLVSLAVNVAIAGFVGTQWFKHGGMRDRQLGLTFNRKAALAVLDQPQKKEIRTIWKSRRPEMRSHIKEYRQAKRQMSALLSAETLDPDAVNNAHRIMLEHRNNIDRVLNRTLLESAQMLPPEQRADFFKTGFKRWRSRHLRRGDHSASSPPKKSIQK